MSKATFLLLTYRTHIDKDEYKGWFPMDIKEMGIAHETGDDECPYEHSHMVIHLSTRKHISGRMLSEYFDYDGIHPHLKILKGKKAYKDALKYISKEDSDIGVEIELTFAERIEIVGEADTCLDALIASAKSFSDIVGIKALWVEMEKYKVDSRHQEYHNSIKELELSKVQNFWWSKLESQDDRKITWVCDYDGGLGKSTFGKWLRVMKGAQRLLLNSKAVHFMYSGAEYVYINISRSSEEFVSYGALEDLKDGEMVSDKYEGREKLYAPPKVIVFANFAPDLSMMTSDRWDLVFYGTED